MNTTTVEGRVDTGALLQDYLDHVAALGLSPRSVRVRTRIAAEFLSAHPDPAAWMVLPAAERAAELKSSGAWPLLCYAIGADRIRLDVELAAVKQLTGLGAAVEARDPVGFSALRLAGHRLGWTDSWVATVLGEGLAVVLACHGGLIADLTTEAIDDFDQALSASSIPASSRRPIVPGWPACANCCTRPGSWILLLDDGRGHAASSSASPMSRWPDRFATPCCGMSGFARPCCSRSRWNR